MPTEGRLAQMGKLWSGGKGEHSSKIMSLWRWCGEGWGELPQFGQDLCQSRWLTTEPWSAATSPWLCFCFLPAQHCLGCGQCPWRWMGLLASRGLPFPSWGIADEFKSCSSLGKIAFTFFSPSFVCSFTPEPEPLTSWWKNSASNPGTCLWLLLTYLSLIQSTLNELIPAHGHTGFFLSSHQDKTDLQE